MTGPRVSVVIPVRNGAKLLPRAVESVLAQSVSDIEVVVVDDGSTDSTPAVISHMQDPRIVLHRQEPAGVSSARNAGVSLARGEWIAFLDSDDEALGEWLETLMTAATAANADLACCGILVHSDGSPKGRAVLPMAGGQLYFDRTVLFLAGSFLVRRHLLVASGGYDTALTFSENTELGIRLVDRCVAQDIPLVAIDRPLVRYHQRPQPTGVNALPVHRRRLDAIRHLLTRHADAFARDPTSRATHLSLAGVLAVRLGLIGEARNHFAAALRTRPLHLIYLVRWIVTWIPGLPRRLWGSCGR